jgi:hypothetical protein
MPKKASAVATRSRVNEGMGSAGNTKKRRMRKTNLIFNGHRKPGEIEVETAEWDF